MQKQKGNRHSNPDHKVDVVDGQFVLARVSFDPLLVAEVLPSSPRGRKLPAVLLVPHLDQSSSVLVPAVVQYTIGTSPPGDRSAGPVLLGWYGTAV